MEKGFAIAMCDVLMVVDESGAKSRANKVESSVGEFGVMAGFMIPLEHEQKARDDLAQLFKEASASASLPAGAKVHITDFPGGHKESLRATLFEYFRAHQIPWMYEAIYVQGIFENEQKISALADKALESRRSTVKISKNREITRMYDELFMGLFGKASAFCLDYLEQPTQLKIVTDQIDAPVLKQLDEAVREFKEITKPKSYRKTGFDTSAGKVVAGKIEIEIKGVEGLADFSTVGHSISCEDTPLTFAADILSHSIYTHLSAMQKERPGAFLNAKSSISGHPLEEFAYGFLDEGEYCVDLFYRHPLNFGTAAE